MYNFAEGGAYFDDGFLEPYTEPTEFAHEVNFASKEPKSDDMEEKHRNLSQETANCDKAEEKELNLCEILKDHIGETFFHPMRGDVEITEITDGYISYSYGDGYSGGRPVTDCVYPTGMTFLYPDAESLKKYPFDGLVAWQEWIEANKPKYEMQGGFSVFLNGKPEADFDMPTLTFESLDLAQQAAEAVKATLMKFHNNLNNNEK